MGLFDRVRTEGAGGSGSAGAGGAAGGGEGPLGRVREAGGDAVQLTIDYLKQETLGPIKGVGRFLALGVAGSVALSVGAVLLLVALLRVLQGETGTTFAGNLSWVPYLIVSVVAMAIIALAVWRIAKGPAARRLPAIGRPGAEGNGGAGAGGGGGIGGRGSGGREGRNH